MAQTNRKQGSWSHSRSQVWPELSQHPEAAVSLPKTLKASAWARRSTMRLLVLAMELLVEKCWSSRVLVDQDRSVGGQIWVQD